MSLPVQAEVVGATPPGQPSVRPPHERTLALAQAVRALLSSADVRPAEYIRLWDIPGGAE